MPNFTWTIPIKTVSEANSTDHWLVKANRHKQQQRYIRLYLSANVDKCNLPCKITMTRLAPRRLDSDNLQSAFKYIRDEISELLIPDKVATWTDKKGLQRKIKGRADDDPRLTWQYSQERQVIQGIRVDIEFNSVQKPESDSVFKN